MTVRRVLASALTTLLLAACAGIPDKLPPPKLRTDAPLAGLPTADQAHWPAQDWWKRYNDPQLNRLIDSALHGATSLAAARSRVQNAQASARVTAAQVGLRVNGSAKVSRQRLSENGLIPPRFLGFTWYTQSDLGVQASYDFDLWGGHRAAVKAAIGQVRAAAAERSAAALALEAKITTTYFGWLADHQRLKLAHKMVKGQEHLENILQLRVRAGLEPSDPLQQTRAQIAGTRQQVAALRGSARIRRAVLAALIGVSPDALPELQPRPLPQATAGLPAHAGLDLIARRPDIAARRWQVEAALRKTDAVRAKFFPDLNLTALAGLSSLDMGKLLNPGSRVFALTPALHLPIFEGGRLRAGYGLSKAQLQAAVAGYNDTVVNAARDVATQALNIQRLHDQSRQQQLQLQAVTALKSNANSRQRQGVTDIQPVLKARLQWLRQKDAVADLNAQTLNADVGLVKALGGGYRMHDSTADTAAPATPASTPAPARKPTP